MDYYKKRQKKQKNVMPPKLAAAALGLLFLFALAAAVHFVPGFADEVYRMAGIVQVDVKPSEQITGNTKIHVIDVGQGDATLIEQSGQFALVDAGTRASGDELLAYLRAVGVKKLEYVFMTHPHADHIGSMNAVLGAFKVKLLVLPDFEKAPYPTTSLFVELLETVKREGIAAQTAKEDDVYSLGSGSITVLQNGIEAKTNYNLLSLMLLFEADGLRMLCSGDAEKANEKALLKSGKNISADVLILGHHGSSTSNCDEFLDAVRPVLTVASCGFANDYGHPHREVLGALETRGVRVARTDEMGSVVVGIDKDGAVCFASAKSEQDFPKASVAA